MNNKCEASSSLEDISDQLRSRHRRVGHNDKFSGGHSGMTNLQLIPSSFPNCTVIQNNMDIYCE